MWQTLRLAYRNVFRNRRRTFMVMSSITVGVVALALISGFVSTIRYALYTTIVRNEGHVQIMPRNYLDLGASNPGSFYIADWRQIVRKIREASGLGDRIRVMAPLLRVGGIASFSESGATLGFRGAGYVPELYNRMQEWDGFGLDLEPQPLILDPADSDLVLVGGGVARQLQICAYVSLSDCRNYTADENASAGAATEGGSGNDDDIGREVAGVAELVREEADPRDGRHAGMAAIDLMVAAADGAPNARTVWVQDAVSQPRRQQDNTYIAMHLATAQNLLYEDKDRISHILVQFKDADDVDEGIVRIREILADMGRSYDVLPVEEFNGTFTRILGMFSMIRAFIGIVVSLIILFMVANTMAITVLERVNEIGTLRALGEYRSGIRNLFLSEGVVLGVLSATAGIVAAGIAVMVVNAMGLEWTTPSSTRPIPIRLLFFETPGTILLIWLLVVAVTTVSSVLPAVRAARYPVAEALRYV